MIVGGDFMDITDEEKIRIMNVKNMHEIQEARAKVPYWQAAGKAFLPEEEHEKWDLYVDFFGNNEMTRGEGLDQSIQVLGMLKCGATPGQIASVLSNYPSAATVTDEILARFVPAEVVQSISASLNSKKINM